MVKWYEDPNLAISVFTLCNCEGLSLILDIIYQIEKLTHSGSLDVLFPIRKGKLDQWLISASARHFSGIKSAYRVRAV